MLKITQNGQQTDFSGDLTALDAGFASLEFERDGFIFNSNANFVATEIEQPVEPPDPPPPSNSLGSEMMPPDYPVTVPFGETKTLGAGPHILNIEVVEGTLIIEDGAQITARGIHVAKTGEIRCGSEESPHANVFIDLVGEKDDATDPFHWYPGITIDGKAHVNGTAVGPEGLVFPDFTRKEQIAHTKRTDWRRFPVYTSDPNAWEITTDWGETVRAGDCNLSRGVTVRGGHIAFLHDAHYHFTNVRSKDALGTLIDRLDKTKIIDGVVVHQGQNNAGRYNFHAHHNHHGAHSKLENCVADGGRKWGFTIHESDNTKWRNNLAFNIQGSGFMREGLKGDGMGFYGCKSVCITGDLNVSSLNVDGRAGAGQYLMPNGDLITDGGTKGDGVWLDYASGCDVEKFIAVGCRGWAINENGYYRTPKGGESLRQDNIKEVYARWCYGAYWASWDQAMKRPYLPRTVTVFADDVTLGVEAWHSAKITFNGRIHADKTISAQSENYSGLSRSTIGVFFASYEAGGMIVNMDVKGFNYGLVLPISNGVLGAPDSYVGCVVNGEFSNDLDVVCFDSTDHGNQVTHDLNINFDESLRPGAVVWDFPHGRLYMRVWRPTQPLMSFAEVNLNGTLHKRTDEDVLVS